VVVLTPSVHSRMVCCGAAMWLLAIPQLVIRRMVLACCHPSSDSTYRWWLVVPTYHLEVHSMSYVLLVVSTCYMLPRARACRVIPLVVLLLSTQLRVESRMVSSIHYSLVVYCYVVVLRPHTGATCYHRISSGISYCWSSWRC
jgi:hypothetical protein